MLQFTELLFRPPLSTTGTISKPEGSVKRTNGASLSLSADGLVEVQQQPGYSSPGGGSCRGCTDRPLGRMRRILRRQVPRSGTRRGEAVRLLLEECREHAQLALRRYSS